MFQPKYKHFLLLLCVIAVAFGAVSLAGGATYYRPANPIMDYVPQNVGIYDTYYCENKESDCRVCHGASTAVRHHATQRARDGNCLFCHRDWPYTVPPERDCKVCHIVGGEVGDYGFPHHRTDLADSGQCNQCHGNVISETNTVEPPNWDTSCITPSPYSCENCHWPSGCTEGEAAVYEMTSGVCTSYPVKFKNDWELWTPVNAPRPTNTPVPTPIFIGANGPVISFNNPLGIPNAYDLWHLPQDQANNRWGTSMETKPFRPAGGLHHDGVGLNDAKVYPKCYNCHAPDPASPSNWDQGNPLLIRFCENCHDTGTLHYGIPEHVQTSGGAGDGFYRVSGVADQEVTANKKCVACHEGYDPALCPWPEMPEVPDEVFVIDRLEPGFGSKGIIVDILPATGTCFIEDPVNGLCSFGTKGVGDYVKVGQYDISVPGWVYYDVPIYSWSEHLIQIKVEGYDLSPGNARVRVHKANPAQTQTLGFSINAHPAIIGFDTDLDNDTDGADINAAGWGNTVGIVGTGFGACREKMETLGPPDYGYSSYVELHASNDIYRIKDYPGPWNPTYLRIKLEDILDTQTGNPVPGESDLYTGCWMVKVITDYFKDDGDGYYLLEDDGLPCSGADDLTTGIIDPDDELLYREISEAKCLNVTKTPVIYCVRPNPVPGGNTATIYGANFGPVKGTSLVKEWKKNHSSAVVPVTTMWANTEIKFKVKPKNPASNKIKDVQVVVNPGNKVSNYYRLTITPPGP